MSLQKKVHFLCYYWLNTNLINYPPSLQTFSLLYIFDPFELAECAVYTLYSHFTDSRKFKLSKDANLNMMNVYKIYPNSNCLFRSSLTVIQCS